MMKKLKQFGALMLALVLAVALCCPALAAGDSYTITINNSDATAQHTYEAYQIFAGTLTTKDGKKVLSNITWGAGVDTAEQVDGKTLAQVFDNKTADKVAEDLRNKTAAEVDAFAKQVAPYLTTHTDSVPSADNKSYTISGLKAGYYLVKDKDGSLSEAQDSYTRYIVQVLGDVETEAKSVKPTLEKEIWHDEKNNGEWDVVGDNKIGDTVKFRTITTVPDTTGYVEYDYIIHDTMSTGLTSNVKGSADVTIKVNNNDGKVLEQKYYTVTVDTMNSNEFSVKIDILAAIADNKMTTGDKLFTYYDGVLNGGAKIYTDKQSNEAYLEYSNNPNDTTSKKETPKDTVYDWTFKMVVNKVAENEDGNPLTGAKFVLSDKADLNVALNDEGNLDSTENLIGLMASNGTYRVATNSEQANATYVIDAGTATITGLNDETTYYLYEVQAPDSYNKLSAPVAFKISATYTNEGSNCVATLLVNNTPASDLTAKIVNKSGSTLPTTGGMGTTVLYVVGGVLVVCAGVALVAKKRMQ